MWLLDPSSVGLGVILLQDQGAGEHKPVAYISRSLTLMERRYSQIVQNLQIHNYFLWYKVYFTG